LKFYPKEEFTFDIPFQTKYCGLEPREINKTKASHPLSQIWRYPADSDGKLWDGVFAFEPTSFLADIRRLRADFKRLHKLILV
jgi:hypothetical protein